MGYLEILNRIVEIINLSSDKKQELESKGIFDKDKINADDKNFYVFYPYYIYKEYYNEFEYLKSKELTFYNLRTDKYAGLKNQTLIKECRNYISNNSTNSSDYREIINIINRCNGKKASELVYIMGYYVCDDDLVNFKKLCNKCHVGFGKSARDNEMEMYEQVENTNKQIEEQKRRIEKHMKSLNKEETSKDIVDSIKEDLPKNITNDIDNEEQPLKEKLSITLNGKYKEFIYLGMLGYLNIKMIIELKNIMTNEEFSELLNDLKKYNIFTQDELLDINIEANEKVKNVNSIDELVAFLVTREGLNVDALKIFIPSIGIENYHYLMDQLFRFNKIDFDTYKTYLEEYNLIGENKSRR